MPGPYWEEKRGKLTGAIAKENLHAIPWDKYEEFLSEINTDESPKSKIDKKTKAAKENIANIASGADPSFGGYGGQ